MLLASTKLVCDGVCVCVYMQVCDCMPVCVYMRTFHTQWSSCSLSVQRTFT
uniref:Uncharacterized protein n=1 Tax=Anguilla anguilla TaxID=7936 RepID=A0A0E9XLR1_ANGAN